MCDPVTIAGLALTGGSIAANTVAQSRVEKARTNAIMGERVRQAQLDAEADALNRGMRGRYEGFPGQQEQRAQELGDYFGAQAAPLPTEMPTASGITVAEEARRMDAARGRSGAEAEAFGNLRSFGDVLGGIGRLQGRDSGSIGQIGGFKAGSSGVLPYELEGANTAGDSLKFLGDILGGTGRIATTAGLSGWGMGGRAAAAPSMAGVPAATIRPTQLGAALPQQPLALGQAMFGRMPTFAQPGNLYRFF